MPGVTPLKLAVVSSGRTFTELAATVGIIDAPSLTKWANDEKGTRTPNTSLAAQRQAAAIAKELGTTVEALWPTEAAAA